jgi:hypothetical protein
VHSSAHTLTAGKTSDCHVDLDTRAQLSAKTAAMLPPEIRDREKLSLGFLQPGLTFSVRLDTPEARHLRT